MPSTNMGSDSRARLRPTARDTATGDAPHIHCTTVHTFAIAKCRYHFVARAARSARAARADLRNFKKEFASEHFLIFEI